MKLILTTLLLVISAASYCQSTTVTLSGKIVDAASGQPLDNATVAVYTTDDATLLAYHTSNTNGNFNVPGLLPNTRIKVMISLFGYEPVAKEITISENKWNSLGTTEMVPGIKMMEEVVVRAKKRTGTAASIR